MSLRADLAILYTMLLSPIRGASHAARLESFYRSQAGAYDDFRARLLHGRGALWSSLAVPQGGCWLDMGGGTGANLEYLGERLGQLARFYLVDLTPSLLNMARQRVQQHGWTNIEIVEADASTFTPRHTPVDVVTFSYSLTMMPEWFAALDHAWHLLRPGGMIGVVDFYISRKYPAPGQVRHPWYTRAFWPLWFGYDNVFPSPDHVPYLHRRFVPQHFSEHRGTVPYAPGLRAPYYIFIGRKSPALASC
ncbi:MAG: class I SAM-dependent methyltransferase [Candidatus Tectimicrobiota bacterium]